LLSPRYAAAPLHNAPVSREARTLPYNAQSHP